MTNIPKYEILEGDTLEAPTGETLYRIRALRDFGDVKAGDLGGYVQYPENLSQSGNGWIYKDAMAYDDAVVMDDAVVTGSARVFGSAVVGEEALIRGDSQIHGDAIISGEALIQDYAEVFGDCPGPGIC